MSDKYLRKFGNIYAICHHPLLDLCVVQWGEYPIFIYDKIGKIAGWKIHTEYYTKYRDTYKSLLYVQDALKVWHLVDYERKTVDPVLKDFSDRFTIITDSLLAYFKRGSIS